MTTSTSVQNAVCTYNVHIALWPATTMYESYHTKVHSYMMRKSSFTLRERPDDQWSAGLDTAVFGSMLHPLVCFLLFDDSAFQYVSSLFIRYQKMAKSIYVLLYINVDTVSDEIILIRHQFDHEFVIYFVLL